MCFTIHKDHPTVKIATEDIACYKRLEVETHSFFKTKITRGNLSTLKFTTPYFHQRIFLQYKPLKGSSIDVGFKFIEKGLHSYSHPTGVVANTWRRALNEVVVKCIIPKGSKYYYNPDSLEYVSNKLQYTTKFVTNDCDYIEIKDKKLICKVS